MLKHLPSKCESLSSNPSMTPLKKSLVYSKGNLLRLGCVYNLTREVVVTDCVLTIHGNVTLPKKHSFESPGQQMLLYARAGMGT
jgi:hypothetical protein